MQDMSQRQLAEIAHIAQSYLAEVEQGRRSIGFDKLCQLADALDVDIVSLVTGVMNCDESRPHPNPTQVK